MSLLQMGAAVCLALLPHVVSAADYTVNTNGSGSFTTIQACANAVHPGDTCVVHAGAYPEHPQTSRGGTADKYITIKAATGAIVITKGFRIRHPYVRIEGFDITKYTVGLDQAHIRVEPEADSCQIVGNVIRDGIYLTSRDLRFDGPTKTITNPAGGFVAAGFVAGASIYIGSDINNQIRNHDNAGAEPYRYETKMVKAVTDTTLTLVDANTVFTEGPVPSTIYVNSAEKNGMWGILFISSTTRGVANNCLIQGNRFSNLAGKAIHIAGNNHLVERNTFERMNGWRMLTFVGNNHVFRYNIFRNSPRWPGFSLPKSPVASQGSGTWDMYDVLFASYGEQADNNIIEYNYIEHIDEQFAHIEEQGARLIIRNNIFVGYEMTGGISRPETQIVNNTFYKTAWGNSQHNFNLAKSSVHGNPVGSVIKNNAFIETAKATDTYQWLVTQFVGMTDCPRQACRLITTSSRRRRRDSSTQGRNRTASMEATHSYVMPATRSAQMACRSRSMMDSSRSRPRRYAARERAAQTSGPIAAIHRRCSSRVGEPPQPQTTYGLFNDAPPKARALPARSWWPVACRL